MTTREILFDYLTARRFRTAEDSPDRYYSDRWFRYPIAGRRVPLFPLWRTYRDALVIHDLHHLVTGYDTDWTGEMEITGWEIGSGGCGRRLAMWIDRLIFLPIAFLTRPRATWRAFLHGRRCHRNLYRHGLERTLRTDFEAVKRYLKLG